MNVYVDKNGFVHLRKSKNRWYLGQLVSEVKKVEEVEVLLNPKLSNQVYEALSKAKIEACKIVEES